ncbi:DNA mismatch repair protein MutT [Yoonia sp. BS5-3]|uniref:DNA mismatch repair protein MutT n=1 Tax=Yoonia phaeophyticola TaxID=3137369 RepID=A0ABZ2V913_9RHOB
METAPPIRDAATVIVLRNAQTKPSVLMGQRGASAAFMPGKFVFPGGAVDQNDHHVPLTPLSGTDETRLAEESALPPAAIVAAGIRELWEETGQILGAAANWPDAPQGWRGFAATGHQPNGTACRFVFRAVTPQGRPRRFDARFLLADAADLVTDPDDFSRAENELDHLQWVRLDDARSFDLPFITQVVLAELITNLDRNCPPTAIPFFRNDDEAHLISRLGGKAIL